MPVGENGSGKYGLVLDGTFNGWLTGVDLGGVSAPVDADTRRVSRIMIQDTVCTLESKPGPQIAGWLSQVVSGNRMRKDLEIVYLDYNLKALNTLFFQGAQLSEVAFPACGTGSKDPGNLLFRFRPDRQRMQTGNPSKALSTWRRPPMFRASDFKLSIEGIDCSTVSEISGITLKMNSSRQNGYSTQSSAGTEIVLRLPDRQSAPFVQWSRGSQNATKPGTLEYGSSLKLVVDDLLLISVGQDKGRAAQAGKTSVRLFCSQFSMKWS